MPSDLMSIITSGGQTATASKAGVVGTSTTKRGEMPSNPLLDALTERLLKQGEGISSSSSSALQAEIAKAMKDTETAGASSAARIQSEREREMGYARDSASATYTTALEGRTGYATQVSALRELTNTTEKSVRDLDQRYQEALLANDAATASALAGLRIKKLEFQQEQEQNFFNNIMSVANMQQSAIDSMMRREEFWAGQEQQQNQFVMQMAQSKYQFEQNLGMQFKELGLKEQELDIARERNSISRAEFNLKKSEIEKEKSKMVVSGTVFKDMRNEIMSRGVKAEDLDPSAYAIWASEMYKTQFPNATFDDFFETALLAKDEFVSSGIAAPVRQVERTGGIMGALKSGWNLSYGALGGRLGEAIFGKEVR